MPGLPHDKSSVLEQLMAPAGDVRDGPEKQAKKKAALTLHVPENAFFQAGNVVV